MKKINEELKKMYEEQQKALKIEILKKAGCKDLKEFLEKGLKVKVTQKTNNIEREDGYSGVELSNEFEIIYPNE